MKNAGYWRYDMSNKKKNDKSWNDKYRLVPDDVVKNLVELHGGVIAASNNTDQRGARIEIAFPKV